LILTLCKPVDSNNYGFNANCIVSQGQPEMDGKKGFAIMVFISFVLQ